MDDIGGVKKKGKRHQTGFPGGGIEHSYLIEHFVRNAYCAFARAFGDEFADGMSMKDIKQVTPDQQNTCKSWVISLGTRRDSSCANISDVVRCTFRVCTASWINATKKRKTRRWRRNTISSTNSVLVDGHEC